jgi:hypothetical protein
MCGNVADANLLMGAELGATMMLTQLCAYSAYGYWPSRVQDLSDLL